MKPQRIAVHRRESSTVTHNKGFGPPILGNRCKCSLSDRQKRLIQLIRPVTHAQKYAKYQWRSYKEFIPKPCISLKLMELGRSNQTYSYSHKQDLRPSAGSFLQRWWRGQCPQLKLFQTSGMSEMSRARKLILGLQVNIDKANSRR